MARATHFSSNAAALLPAGTLPVAHKPTGRPPPQSQPPQSSAAKPISESSRKIGNAEVPSSSVWYIPRNQKGGNHNTALLFDRSSAGVTPDKTGNSRSSITSTVTAEPCSSSEILRNRRSPSIASSVLCSATINTAANSPPAATAATCPARKLGNMRTNLPPRVSITGAKEVRIEQETRQRKCRSLPTRPRRLRRCASGNVPSTNTSSRSGKNKSHSKTAISPMTTNEYSTKKK